MKCNSANDPAFPSMAEMGGHEVVSAGDGLTVREWYAGMALCGIMVNAAEYDFSSSHVAEWAFDIANAMLAQSKKE